MGSQRVFFGLRRGLPQRRAINAAIARLREVGLWRRLRTRYFPKTFGRHVKHFLKSTFFFLRRRFHSRIYQTLKRAEKKIDGAFFCNCETINFSKLF